MKKLYSYILLLGLLYVVPVHSQNDSVTVLDEVVLTDVKLKHFSTGQTLIRISDSLTRHNPLLTSILNFNTPIYFKENGLGMVSSPSFRGTSASHTAVLWNGININSQFNGQTDFNTLNTASFDEIAVRGGGGSVIYGTGAIGGTVHLNNHLSFRERFDNEVYVQYGSFNTLDARYKLKAAREKWSLSISGARNSSDNDYEYPDGRFNENGQFYNNAVNIGLGYRINNKNTLKLYSDLFEGERHFSLIRPSETRTKYRDINSRNLLEWVSEFSNFVSVSRLAYLDENYKYYGNIVSEDFSFGEAATLVAQHDLKYTVSDKFRFNTVFSNTYTDGEGSSLGQNSRNIFSGAFLMKHWLNDDFQYEIGVRKEVTQNYESPFLYSLGANYQLSEFYDLKIKASRNFRIPTYNDLYWASSGNADLNSETSKQVELGNDFSFEQWKLSLTGYYNYIEDMIRWLPGEGSVWRPRNEDRVHTYGAEVLLGYAQKFNKHNVIELNATYAYTVSENLQTRKQLTYVPYHKANGSLAYTFRRLTLDYQFLYNGEVFTRSDNNSRYNIKAYTVSNVGASYAIGKNNDYRLGGRINNVFNEEYQNVENRWMPGMNFNIYLNLNL